MSDTTLDRAILKVLRDKPGLLPRQLADGITARGLWERPSDGQPVQAKQVSARVRTKAYRDFFRIDDDGRIYPA